MNSLKFHCATANKICNNFSLLSAIILHRGISTSRILCKSHYTVLGITSKATQTDVKSAYYKMSMIYHPDKNTGCSDAAEKFRDITTAYEILSNYRLRRLYDKGIIHTAGPQYEHTAEDTVVPDVEDDPQTKFYRRHMSKTEVPHATGRTPIYNFDEWTEAHYGKTFARRQTASNKYRDKINQDCKEENSRKTEMVIIGVLSGLIGMMIICLQVDTFSLDSVDNKKIK